MHAACVVLAVTAIASATAAPGAATSGGRLREYQPGVTIDWDNGAVHVDTRVVLRQGQLEFLACFHSKDHESILRCEARATAVFQAMGLAGMTPGHPPRWNDVTGDFDAPAGDLVDILLRWDGVAQTHTINACDWLRTIEFGRAPIERPWVFGGSILLEDGLVASEYSGVGVATVDFVDSLIAYSRRYPSILGGVWVAADTDAIPDVGTRVTMIIRPARPRVREVALDFRGVITVDGQSATSEDLADILCLARQLDQDFVQRITVTRTLKTDVLVLRRRLESLGVGEDMVRFDRIDAGDRRGETRRPRADH